MVETSKQVRVDNWGIYFLQRLQLFFSKTDYCDLTLQFEGNVQLKVHRLVMNACTEYFSFLEQTCASPLEDNTILMPPDLQADVIVPIVNFMYTGMLEFHPSIYDKLYRAADTMNIAVLSKLLEAQLAPMSKTLNRAKREKETSSWRDSAKKTHRGAVVTPSTAPASDLSFPSRRNTWKKRSAISQQSASSGQPHPVSATFNSKWSSGPIERDPLSFPDNTPKPTRFEWPEEEIAPISSYPSFDDVSLTSKPLWTKEDDQKAAPTPVEENKQRLRSRKTSIQDYEDESLRHKEQKVNNTPTQDSALNDTSSTVKRKAESTITSSPKRIKTEEEETIISVTTSNPSEVDHTKIVSEVLKKYPDLVKKKRSIKLKIIQAKTDQPIIKIQTVREKAPVKEPQPLPSPVEAAQRPSAKEIKKETPTVKETAPKKEPSYINKKKSNTNGGFRAVSEDGPWICLECAGQDREGAEFVLYYLFRKHMADQHKMEFDSSLCKYCGRKCSKENFMIYHLYTKHGLKPPKNVTFPKCNTCPFIAPTEERLQEHVVTHGKTEVQCQSCQLGFYSKKELQAHVQLAAHSSRKTSILDCAYCMKKLQNPVTLFTHVRSQHLKEARRDGVTSLDEVMDIQKEVEKEPEPAVEVPPPTKVAEVPVKAKPQETNKKQRVKIISNVKVASTEEDAPEENATSANEGTSFQETEAQPVAVTTAATLSNIGGSIATNLGLVDIVVLDDNQQYILQQPQVQAGNAEFILPSELAGTEGRRILQAAAASGELNSTDELVMVLTDHDYPDGQSQGQSDNSNIVVLYSHPVEGQEGQFITSQGNLLVNSEGVLEIRNGAAITTTAGQILVADSTTTTQAADSPVESIELIRKAIAGNDTIDNKHLKTKIKKKVKKPVKFESDTNGDEVRKDDNLKETSDNYVKLPNDESNAPLDAIDSSLAEEPMEVDDIEPSPSTLQEGPEQEDKGYIEESTGGEHEGGVDEEKCNLGQEGVEVSQDVPPDTTPSAQADESGDTEGQSDDTHVVIGDQPQASSEEEPMEVDGGLKPPAENRDEVDSEELQAPNTEESQQETLEQEHSNAVNNETSAIEELSAQNVESNRAEDGEAETSYDDFVAEESQDSSAQEARKNFNKELLDDWEDTDSQQSHGHELESHESEAEPAVLKASENVNKLMDDWDDEEEDQSKE